MGTITLTTTSPSGGGGVSSVPTGNVLWVDAVNGNDATAVSGQLDKPYLTIVAALGAAVSGDLVYVLPGSYDEENLTIPSGVTLAGVDRLRCSIAHTTASNNDIVTMGAGTCLENLTIEGASIAARNLVTFPGTTSADSVVRNCVLIGTGGNVNGFSVAGTATSPQEWVTADMVDVRGAGVANGFVSSSTGFFVVRDCVLFGLVGANVAAGSVEFQDCKIIGFTGLNIAAGATAFVNQSTRWNNLVNAGTLSSAGDYFRELPLAHATSHESGGGDEIDVTGLLGLLADAQTPLAHAATHLSTGSDPIDEFVGASAVSDGLDGLVKKPVAGEESLFLKGDGTWAAPAGGGGVSGPGVSIDKGIVIWDGTGGATLADSGLRNYGASATDPTTPAPADGDTYYNTAMNMHFDYDGSRSKWLSRETCEIAFNRSGNTGAGAYYRMGNRAMAANRGRTAEWDGTIVSISYTRNDVDAATFEVAAGGVGIATLASAANTGSTVAADGDFSQSDVISVRNQAGGNVTRHVIGFVRLKWRAT